MFFPSIVYCPKEQTLTENNFCKFQAGQATEPESLISACLIGDDTGQVMIIKQFNLICQGSYISLHYFDVVRSVKSTGISNL